MNERLTHALASAKETRACVIGQGVLNETPALLREQFGDKKALVIADTNTFKAAGAHVQEVLKAAELVGAEPIILAAEGLYAEISWVDQLTTQLAQNDLVPVAVGSGTINDITKLAAHRCQRQYMCVGTAASMDGYTAFGASITADGSKQTFTCPAPRAVLADLDVIAKAPPAMTASGYADLMAKVVAGADWLVADALGVEAIDDRAWEIVQGGLPSALSDPSGARQGNIEAIEALIEGLMLGGFAMQWSQTSRPASGAEHQFSHLWDMEHHTHNGVAPSHGFKVGVATHFIARMYECALATPFDKLDVAAACAQWPTWEQAKSRALELYAGTDFPELGVKETQAKYIDQAALKQQLEQLKSVWPKLRERLSQQLLSASETAQRLHAVGAPSEPEEIGISRQRMRDSVIRAQHMRRRFTILDLALRTAHFDTWLKELFN